MTTLEQQQNTINEQGIGSALLAGRTQAGLKASDVGAKLNLSEQQICALENEAFSSLGPTTFVKGYIRAYCKLVEIDPEPLLVNFKPAPEKQSEGNMQSFSRRTEREANDNRLMLFSYLVLVIIVGSSIVIWWQNREPAIEPSSSLSVQQSNDTVSKMQEQQPTATRFAAIENANQQATLNVEAQSPSSTNIEQTSQLAIEVKAVSEEPVPTPIATPAPISTESSAEGAKIVMQFKGDSWVEIFDASGDRVAFGVKKKGYKMTVTGTAPFNVVLGKHHLVTVYLDDQVIDLSAFPTNRLAKFNLPLTE